VEEAQTFLTAMTEVFKYIGDYLNQSNAIDNDDNKGTILFAIIIICREIRQLML
jgi:hypothetical protein